MLIRRYIRPSTDETSEQSEQLKRAFCLSLAGAVLSSIILAGITIAWFTTSETTRHNSVDAGVIAVELFQSDENYESRTEINEDEPLFGNIELEPDPEAEQEIIRQLVVSNHGTLRAEHNIGISIEDVTGEDDISGIIDVFMAKYDPEEESQSPYIYLGTLDYMSNNSNYEEDERIYIKGLLDPPNKAGTEEEDAEADILPAEDFYSIRLVMRKVEEGEYEDCFVTINMELVSNKKVDDICTITALPDDEEKGLVLGGGTYYIDDEHEIGLIPQPKKGYKFQKWEDDSSTDDPRIITTDGDQTYTAIFVKDKEPEEGTDDPFADDDDE